MLSRITTSALHLVNAPDQELEVGLAGADCPSVHELPALKEVEHAGKGLRQRARQG